ncbi:MAG TPA: hypothetical protein VJ926_03890 [Patescibacteria group bacterium]|nr:hypothetical protein [Patescibacteria group bacterium]
MSELFIFSSLSILFLTLFIIEIVTKKEKRQLPRLWLAIFIIMLIITISHISNHPELITKISPYLSL